MSLPESRIYSKVVYDDGLDQWERISVHAPSPLRRYVGGYTDYREQTTTFATHRELPAADGLLIVNLAQPITVVAGDGSQTQIRQGEAFIAGPQTKPAFFRSTGLLAGLRVRMPMASLRRLLKVPMGQFSNQAVKLSALMNCVALSRLDALANSSELSERIEIVDSALIRYFSVAPELPHSQLQALGLLEKRPDLSISEAAKQLGWSSKHFSNRIRDVVGVGPQKWRRMLRFQQLTKRLLLKRNINLASTAQELGYFDQPHMNREFREFAGLSPTAFLSGQLLDKGNLLES